jgi:hypothetical protein
MEGLFHDLESRLRTSDLFGMNQKILKRLDEWVTEYWLSMMSRIFWMASKEG